MAGASSNSGRVYGGDPYADIPLQEERRERRRSSQASSSSSTRDPAREQQTRDRQRASSGNRAWIEGGRPDGVRSKIRALQDLVEQAGNTAFETIEEEVGESVNHARERMRDIAEVNLGVAKVNLKGNVNGGRQVSITSPGGKFGVTGKMLSDELKSNLVYSHSEIFRFRRRAFVFPVDYPAPVCRP